MAPRNGVGGTGVSGLELEDDPAPPTPRQPAPEERLAAIEAIGIEDKLAHLEAQGGQLLDEIRRLASINSEAIEAGKLQAMRLDLIETRVGITDQRVISFQKQAEGQQQIALTRAETIQLEVQAVRKDLALAVRRLDSLCGLLREDTTDREDPVSDAPAPVRK